MKPHTIVIAIHCVARGASETDISALLKALPSVRNVEHLGTYDHGHQSAAVEKQVTVYIPLAKPSYDDLIDFVQTVAIGNTEADTLAFAADNVLDGKVAFQDEEGDQE